MAEDTTDEGVLEEHEKAITPDSINLMDDIAKRNAIERDKETVLGETELDNMDYVDDAYEEPEEPEDVVEPEVQEDMDLVEDEPSEFVEINAAGEKKQIPLSEVIEQGKATLQKETTADQRLAKAAEAFKLLQQRAAELDAKEAELYNYALTSENDKINKTATKYSEGFIDGDEEAATEFIEKTLSSVANVDAKIQRLEKELANNRQAIDQQQRKERAELSRIYAEEFSDVSSDNNLHSLAQQRAVAIRAENPDLSEKVIMRMSCEDVRNWVSNFKDPGSVKRDMPKQPKRAGGRMPPKPKRKRKTASDIINEIRKERGVMMG